MALPSSPPAGRTPYNRDNRRNNDPFAAQGARSLLNINAMLQTAGGYELLLWGRNLADESWFGTVFDTPLQDGKLSAYPREPRTYGLSLRRRF